MSIAAAVFVRPANGRQVLREDNTFFPQEWSEAENTPYLRRRMAEGDLELRPARSGKEIVAAQAKESKNG